MRPTIAFLCLLTALVLAGCGTDDEGDRPRVVATTSVAAELATRVAGPEAEVVQLVPDGASPHDFQLSAEDRLELERADLIVAVGGGLEAGIPIEDAAAPRWTLVEHAAGLLPFGEAGAHEHETEEHAADATEEHAADEAVDPHLWMDPTRVAGAAPSLAAALAEIAPGARAELRRRASEYAGGLRRLDRELRSTLATVAPADRKLVTSHDSLAYLADRYGFEVVATAFPSSGPQAEASAAQLQEVVEAIDEHDVPAVFAAREDDPEALRLVAERAGVEIEDALLVESLGPQGSLASMLRRDAELIAAALGTGSRN